MSAIYQHPDGHSIDYADNTLIATDSDGKSVTIPIGTYGLLLLGDELASVADGLPTNGNGPDATHDRPATIHTQNATRIIALYAHIRVTIVRCASWMAVAARGLS